MATTLILLRYLARETLMSLIAVSVTLLLIVMSSRFVKYLAQAASGDLAPEAVLAIMAYRLPAFLELVLPLGLFIAILLSYGRLYVESEMTVMSACGLSTGRLALYTLVPGVIVALLVGWLSLYASPTGIAKVQELYQNAKNASSLDLLLAGRFRVEDKSGRVSYVQKLSDDRTTMSEVFSAEQAVTENGVKLSVVLAEKAQIQVNYSDNSRYLVLENGNRYIGQPGSRDFQVTSFERFGQLMREPEAQKKFYKRTDAKSTTELLESPALEDRATLQWRLSLVILVPIVALIAQALSKTNHRRGRYVKMLPAFLIYIFYLVILNAARSAVEDGELPVAPGLWWIHGVFLALALVLLFGEESLRYLAGSKSGEPDRSGR